MERRIGTTRVVEPKRLIALHDAVDFSEPRPPKHDETLFPAPKIEPIPDMHRAAIHRIERSIEQLETLTRKSPEVRSAIRWLKSAIDMLERK